MGWIHEIKNAKKSRDTATFMRQSFVLEDLFISQSLKGHGHEIFWTFFISLIEPIWALDNQAEMDLFLKFVWRRYLRKIRPRTVLACTESDAAQANTARSWKFKCPQIQNWLTLCGVGLGTG